MKFVRVKEMRLSSRCARGSDEEERWLTAYPGIFRPLAIGPVEVANRLYLTPHGPMLTPRQVEAAQVELIVSTKHAYQTEQTSWESVWRAPRTGIATEFDLAVPCFRTIAELPVTPAGTVIATWYRPTNPGDAMA